METTLHRQLKSLYAPTNEAEEVSLDGFRIDAVADDGRLIEVQCASLGAIRSKIRRLTDKHDVLVVKPLTVRKRIVKRRRKRGKVVSRRMSPKRGDVLDAFDDLVYFVSAFPHERLAVELVLVEIEEHRLPPLRNRWTRKQYRVEDRKLVDVRDRVTLHEAADLYDLLPGVPESPFTTHDLAVAADVPRWMAQKIAYCLRHTGAAGVVGKRGNAFVYEQAESSTKPRRRAG